MLVASLFISSSFARVRRTCSGPSLSAVTFPPPVAMDPLRNWIKTQMSAASDYHIVLEKYPTFPRLFSYTYSCANRCVDSFFHDDVYRVYILHTVWRFIHISRRWMGPKMIKNQDPKRRTNLQYTASLQFALVWRVYTTSAAHIAPIALPRWKMRVQIFMVFATPPLRQRINS